MQAWFHPLTIDIAPLILNSYLNPCEASVWTRASLQRLCAMASTSSRPSSRAGRSRSQSRSRANSRGAGAYDQHGSGTNEYGADSGQDDFCNAFWESGQADDPMAGQERGYENLMARMKSAGKMVDDFRAFFKERCGRGVRMAACGKLTRRFRQYRSTERQSKKTTPAGWQNSLACLLGRTRLGA